MKDNYKAKTPFFNLDNGSMLLLLVFLGCSFFFLFISHFFVYLFNGKDLTTYIKS